MGKKILIEIFTILNIYKWVNYLKFDRNSHRLLRRANRSIGLDKCPLHNFFTSQEEIQFIDNEKSTSIILGLNRKVIHWIENLRIYKGSNSSEVQKASKILTEIFIVLNRWVNYLKFNRNSHYLLGGSTDRSSWADGVYFT